MGSRYFSRMHPDELLAALMQEKRKLDHTRFLRRERGEYLCKSLAEDRFIRDCQHYVDTQMRALDLLVGAVRGYIHAKKALEKC